MLHVAELLLYNLQQGCEAYVLDDFFRLVFLPIEMIMKMFIQLIEDVSQDIFLNKHKNYLNLVIVN